MKRTIGFMLALMLLVLPSKVSAQENVTIAVPDATATAGETLELIMSVRNSTGISGSGLTVSYDTRAMRLTDIVPLESGNFLKDIDRSNFSWLNGKDLTGDFDLVKLCFEVFDRASGTYTVSATLTGNLAANITNQNAIPVPANFVSGTVTVEKKDGGGSDVGGTSGGSDGGGIGESTSDGEGSVEEIAPEEPAEIVFTDVTADAYYYDAVLWANENGITSGVGNGLFAPHATCTRAQMVTFLWNAAGCPTVSADYGSFNDVTVNDYYYKAVLWANANNITSGTGNGVFSPNQICTRAQMATFLYKFVEGKVEGSSNPFVDVTVGDYYSQPVQWAVENGITSGTGANTFGPSDPCTRAQIVTFLYRALSDK